VSSLLDPSLRILSDDEGAGAVGWNHWAMQEEMTLKKDVD